MTRNYIILSIQIVIGFGIYYLLTSLIENNLIVLAILLGVALIFVVYGLFQSKNPADVLEIMSDTDKYLDGIEKHKEKPNKYHLLRAYGLIHAGKFEDAKNEYRLITDQEQLKDKHLKFIDTVLNLKIAYQDGNTSLYKGIFNKAVEDEVFKNVNVSDEMFLVHLQMLQGKNKDAEETAKKVIPTIKKRIYIIELEYLLAVSYYNQNKLEDCNAVCEFVIERDFNVIYTSLCQKMHNTLNKV